MPHDFTGHQNEEGTGPQQNPRYPQQHQLVAPGGGVYNANQIFFGTASDGGSAGIPPGSAATNAGSAPGRGARGSTEARVKAAVEDDEGAGPGDISPPENEQDGMLRPANNDPSSAPPQAPSKVSS